VGRDSSQAWAQFRARIAELGGIVVEPEWLGYGKPHRVICSAGHECTPYPATVQRGGLCRTCAGQDPLAAELRFCERIAQLGGTVVEPSWLGDGKPHRVHCAEGHECTPIPSNVHSGQGICRVCAGKTWDAFYVVADRGAGHIKFGITSGDVRPRLAVHRGQGYREVIRVLTGLPGTTAPDIEQAVKAALRLAGTQPVRGREYYDVSALALVLDVADNYPVSLSKLIPVSA